MSLVFTLVCARVRASGIRHAALVAALAAAVTIPGVVQAGGLLTADAGLSRALELLPVAERSITVSAQGFLEPGRVRQDDAAVRRGLGSLASDRPRLEVEFRALADGAGQVFAFGGVDDLAGAVRLTGGRLPRSCTPTRCEVVALAGAGTSVPAPQKQLGLVVVGQAVRTDPRLLSGAMAPPAGSALLLTEGVVPAGAVSALERINRVHAWVVPVDADSVRDRGNLAWSREVAQLEDRLSGTDPALTVVSPSEAVQQARARADTSAARFGLLAGGCAVLMLAAAVAGGAMLRPDHARFITALRRRGLPPGTLRAVTVAEAFLLALVGTVGGILLATAVTAVLAVRAGLPVVDTALTAATRALPADLALLLAGLGCCLLPLWPGRAAAPRPGPTDTRWAWRVLGYAALAAVAGVLLIVSRGSSTGGDDPLPTTLPALLLAAAALSAARAWPWFLAGAARVLPRRAVGLRLGTAGLAGHPMLSATTVALLVAGVGASCFALTYRATLQRGALDQSAFQVPGDVRVSGSNQPGGTTAPPLATAPAAAFAAAAGSGARTYPVLKAAGSVRVSAGDSQTVQFVGLDVGAPAALRRWSQVVRAADPGTLNRVLAAARSGPDRDLPGGKVLSLRVARVPDDAVTAWLRAADGREAAVPLRPVATGAPQLRGELPAGTWALTALTVMQQPEAATRRGHAEGEGESQLPVPAGRIALGELRVDATVVSSPWAGWRPGPGQQLTQGEADGAGGATLLYRLESARAIIEAPAAGASGSATSAPLPVAADPSTASLGRRLTLTLQGRPVIARVALVLPRFPSVRGRFVIADRLALARLLDGVEPGAGQPQELWLDLPSGPSGRLPAGALAAAPFAGLSVTSAADVEHELRTDPVAVGAVRLLLGASGLTALVALATLLLLLVGERFEDADEFYAWEADGVPPQTLRLSLWARAAVVCLVGVPLGTAAGLVLTRQVARLVPLSAGATPPQPPLMPVAGAGIGLLLLVAGLLLTLAASWLVAARAFRGPLPGLPGTGR